jgi:hypothetical protein
MKHFFEILNIVIGLLLVAFTWSYVKSDDVCRTIFGCFALYAWFQFKNS